MKRELIALIIGSVVIFILVNVLILQKEMQIRQGRTVFLPLRPLDPRSLMQGDYMRLRYQLTDSIHSYTNSSGTAILILNKRGIGTFLRIAKTDETDSIPSHQQRIYYLRKKVSKYTYRITLGAESFFFQEGYRKCYEGAKYGEFRISPKGLVRLVNLRGPNLALLTPCNKTKQASSPSSPSPLPPAATPSPATTTPLSSQPTAIRPQPAPRTTLPTSSPSLSTKPKATDTKNPTPSTDTKKPTPSMDTKKP